MRKKKDLNNNTYSKLRMSNKSSILTAFNDHFMEFITDINNVFPEDPDLLTAKNSLIMIRKANPKLTVEIWNNFVVGKYKSEIEAGNIDFFINKDYSDDFLNKDNSDKIMQAIDRLREPVKQMKSDDQQKTMKYIQNLTKLSSIYLA